MSSIKGTIKRVERASAPKMETPIRIVSVYLELGIRI